MDGGGSLEYTLKKILVVRIDYESSDDLFPPLRFAVSLSTVFVWIYIASFTTWRRMWAYLKQ
jgi:hypothetical protein